MDISLETAAKLLTQANNLVITGHIHPDGDCLGSMLALQEYLESLDKKVELLLDDDLPTLYTFLPGSARIRRPGNTPVTTDLLVIVDASDAERVATVKTQVTGPVLNIDHHISNTKFADYWYIDTEAAATGEIILDILRHLKAEISSTIAINLYTAIATDCGFFRYANTTSATLRNAADLIDAGAQPHVIAEFMETKPLASILVLKNILDTLEIHHQGQIATITISPDIGDKGPDTTEGLINYPRNIEGVEIAIMFNLANSQTTRVSFRSRNVDVSRLALSFGGGGHVRAAGCTVIGQFSAVKRQILQAAKKLLAEYNQ